MGTGGIFIIQQDGRLLPLAEKEYDSEDLLQDLLAKYPDLLPGDQIDSDVPRKWLLICREMPLPSEEDGSDRWSVDHLFLDQDGVPTIIEVKRSTDTRIRREVVGQMLDYAANAVMYWPIERLRSIFDLKCEQAGTVSESVLLEFLGPKSNAEEFWQRVKTNLQAGRVRMIFVADQINPELRRIVEFLNQQMDPAEVLAVELRQYIGENIRTLVPRVIGQTAEAQSKKRPPTGESRRWDETSFLQELEKNTSIEMVNLTKKIMKWVVSRGLNPDFGKGEKHGSFVPWGERNERSLWFFAVWTYGRVALYLQHMKNHPAFAPEEKRMELIRRLNLIEEIEIPNDAIAGKPSFDLSALKTESALAQFLAAFDWVLEQYKA